FAQHRNHDGALAWADITLSMNDLLPGVQKQFTSMDGNGQSGTTLQRRLLIRPLPGTSRGQCDGDGISCHASATMIRTRHPRSAVRSSIEQESRQIVFIENNSPPALRA